MDLVARYVYSGLVPGSRPHALDRCLTAYSKHLARALCALSLFYLSMYVLYSHIYCETNSFKEKDHDDFVNDMCLNSRYLTVMQNDHNKFTKYDSYTFIFLCLFFQSFVTHLPWLFLNSRFFGHLSKLQKALSIVNGSLYPNEFSSKDEKKRKKQWRQCIKKLMILQNLLLHCRNGQFVCHYLATRVLALVTITGQVALLEWFLEEPFSQLGIRLMQYWLGWDATNPLSEIFPYTVSCRFNVHGTGFRPQRSNALCFLYFNYVNQYIFSALWFAYSFFAMIFSLQLISSLFHFTCWWRKSKHFANCVDRKYTSLYQIFQMYLTFCSKNRNYQKPKKVIDLCRDSVYGLYHNSFFMLSLTRIDPERLLQEMNLLAYYAELYCPEIKLNCEEVVASQGSEASIDMLLDFE